MDPQAHSQRRFARLVNGWWPALGLVIAAIWVVNPMHDHVWWASHEHVWYLVRVFEYLRAWSGGAFYPRWCPDFYGGYGYPFFNYYAPGVYFGAAVITKVTASDPVFALKLLMTIMAAAGSIGSYGFMLRETKRVDAALLGSACYVFLPYRCTDLFARGDLAEYAAYCLVPFVAWSYRAAASAHGRRAMMLVCTSALAHACVLLTHTLTGLFTTEIVGVYIVVMLVMRRRNDAVLAGVAMMFSIGLAAIYLLPAFFERDLVYIERITASGYKPWLNAVSVKQLITAFFTPGWPFFAGAGIWLASFTIPRFRSAARHAAPAWLIAIALVALMLPGVVSIWKVLPFGEQVQFAWRLLGFVGLFTALAIATWWSRAIPSRRLSLIAASILAACLPLLLSTQRMVSPERPLPLTAATLRDENASSCVMDEYLPRRVTVPPPLRTRLAWLQDGGQDVQIKELDPLHYEVELDASGPDSVVVAVFGFRGWHARKLEGPAAVRTLSGRGDGLVRIVVPQAGHYRIALGFKSTPFRTLAALISALALLLLYPTAWFLVRRSG